MVAQVAQEEAHGQAVEHHTAVHLHTVQAVVVVGSQAGHPGAGSPWAVAGEGIRQVRRC